MPDLTVGDVAPPFSAVDQSGQNVSLTDFSGKTVILYFYPKDDTPGCTKEACNFRDDYNVFLKRGIIILGVSPDSAKSHAKFAEKFSLPFPLLADSEKKIVKDYGVWVEKSMYGKKYMGVERSTFAINPQGYIQGIYRKVKPETHASDLLSAFPS